MAKLTPRSPTRYAFRNRHVAGLRRIVIASAVLAQSIAQNTGLLAI